MKEQQLRQRLTQLGANGLQTIDIVFLALFIAFTAAATFIFIPGPGGSYFNLGEIAIYLIALLCGPLAGLVAGAVGSALADIILGYAIWAPFTFVIKGLEGLVVGILGRPLEFKRGVRAIVAGGLIMIVGYALAVWYLYDWPAVFPEIGIDIAQVTIGGVVALPLALKLDRLLKERS